MSFALKLAGVASLYFLAIIPAYTQEPDGIALNNQLQWGDVFATMKVESHQPVATGITSSAVAAGNAATGVNETGGLNVSSTQVMSGATFGTSFVSADDACCQTVSHAVAQGNSLQTATNGGDLELLGSQTANGGDVLANAEADIRNTGLLSVATSAAANNTIATATNGDLTSKMSQDSQVSVYAYSKADACCTGATVASSSAAANTYTSSSETATVDTDVTQTSTGATVHAANYVSQNKAHDVTSASVAAGNSAQVANKWGYSDVSLDQENQSSVKGESRVWLNSWDGTAVFCAYGVGNSGLVTNVGSDMRTNTTQYNTGDVNAYATFDGGAGSVSNGAVVSSSTAIGNAYTGWLCALCGGDQAGTITQTNGGTISATGSVTTNNAGYITGSATAIGNSATFITSSSGN